MVGGAFSGHLVSLYQESRLRESWRSKPVSSILPQGRLSSCGLLCPGLCTDVPSQCCEVMNPFFPKLLLVMGSVTAANANRLSYHPSPFLTSNQRGTQSASTPRLCMREVWDPPGEP